MNQWTTQITILLVRICAPIVKKKIKTKKNRIVLAKHNTREHSKCSLLFRLFFFLSVYLFVCSAFLSFCSSLLFVHSLHRLLALSHHVLHSHCVCKCQKIHSFIPLFGIWDIGFGFSLSLSLCVPISTSMCAEYPHDIDISYTFYSAAIASIRLKLVREREKTVWGAAREKENCLSNQAEFQHMHTNSQSWQLTTCLCVRRVRTCAYVCVRVHVHVWVCWRTCYALSTRCETSIRSRTETDIK